MVNKHVDGKYVFDILSYILSCQFTDKKQLHISSSVQLSEIVFALFPSVTDTSQISSIKELPVLIRATGPEENRSIN